MMIFGEFYSPVVIQILLPWFGGGNAWIIKVAFCCWNQPLKDMINYSTHWGQHNGIFFDLWPSKTYRSPSHPQICRWFSAKDMRKRTSNQWIMYQNRGIYSSIIHLKCWGLLFPLGKNSKFAGGGGKKQRKNQRKYWKEKWKEKNNL